MYIYINIKFNLYLSWQYIIQQDIYWSIWNCASVIIKSTAANTKAKYISEFIYWSFDSWKFKWRVSFDILWLDTQKNKVLSLTNSPLNTVSVFDGVIYMIARVFILNNVLERNAGKKKFEEPISNFILNFSIQ